VGCAHLGHPWIIVRAAGWPGALCSFRWQKNATQQLRSIFPRAIRSRG
jgi:hypothetical protein